MPMEPEPEPSAIERMICFLLPAGGAEDGNADSDGNSDGEEGVTSDPNQILLP